MSSHLEFNDQISHGRDLRRCLQQMEESHKSLAALKIQIIAVMAMALAVPLGAMAASLTQTLQPNDTLTIAAQSCDLSVTAQSKTVVSVACGPQWTPTPIPPTVTPGAVSGQPCPAPLHPSTGWHPPVDPSSGCYFQHEHGDAPPAWVAHPFTQTRESHVGYKGVLKSMSNGVESYIVTHVISTIAARSHGDHDYELWMRDPSGGISHWIGAMDFGSPPPLRTSDTGERPIILSVGDAGCETWYSRPGAAVFDIGWTICGRYQNFAGVTLGGIGSYRGTDWTVMKDRLSTFPGAAPSLAQYAVTEFGVERYQFIDTGHPFPDTGVVPIN